MLRLVLSFSAMLAGCVEGPEPIALMSTAPVACETAVETDTVFRLTLSGDDLAEFEDDLRADLPSFRVGVSGGDELPHSLVVDFPTLELQPAAPLPPNVNIDIALTDEGALSEAFIPEGLFPLRYSTRDAAAIRSWVVNSGLLFISFSQPLDPASISSDAVAIEIAGTSAAPTRVEWLENAEHTLHIMFPATSGPGLVRILPGLRAATGSTVFDAPEAIELPDVKHGFDGAAAGECLNFRD